MEAKLNRAGLTLRNLPRPVELLRGGATFWPDIVPTPTERLELERDHEQTKRRGHRRDERPCPIRPSARAIDELDEVLGWLMAVDAEARPVVCGKMMDCGFRRLAAKDPKKRSASTLARIHAQAITGILTRLLEDPARKP